MTGNGAAGGPGRDLSEGLLTPTLCLLDRGSIINFMSNYRQMASATNLGSGIGKHMGSKDGAVGA
jgi:hypothetical protein